jgi:hypothetical protein
MVVTDNYSPAEEIAERIKQSARAFGGTHAIDKGCRRNIGIDADRLAALAKVAPCPVCGTHCSGCLEDFAAEHEALRELLSYCKTQDGRYMSPAEAYRDVAGKLAAILDGEK